MELYQRYGDEPPVIEEFVAVYRWLASIDSQGRFSQARRVGKEKPEKEFEGTLRSLIGQEVQETLEQLFAWGDPEFRVVAVSLLNLLGKAFNSLQRLQDRGITRTEGQQFRYDVQDKKVGIIGYGLYDNFFLGKYAQFHTFDLRDAKGLLSYLIGARRRKSTPRGSIGTWGPNALEYAPVLERLDIVIMTGCTIVNDGYRGLLEDCKNAQIRGIYGPSCGGGRYSNGSGPQIRIAADHKGY